MAQHQVDKYELPNTRNLAPFYYENINKYKRSVSHINNITHWIMPSVNVDGSPRNMMNSALQWDKTTHQWHISLMHEQIPSLWYNWKMMFWLVHTAAVTFHLCHQSRWIMLVKAQFISIKHCNKHALFFPIDFLWMWLRYTCFFPHSKIT